MPQTAIPEDLAGKTWPREAVERHLRRAIDQAPALADYRGELRTKLRHRMTGYPGDMTADQIRSTVVRTGLNAGLDSYVAPEDRRALIMACADAMDQMQAELDGTASEPADEQA